jgi:hypothetical protein
VLGFSLTLIHGVAGGTRTFENGYKMEYRSPWLTIWTQPRATIARIVAENPNRSLWGLAFIYGFCSLMNLFQSVALGANLGIVGILLLAIIAAPFYGYLSFTIWSGFVFWIGKLFKGAGSFKVVRSAYAWSCVPILLNIPLWLLMVALFGHQLFLNSPNAQFMPNSQVLLLFVILIVKVVLSIWSLVIYLNALAEVQKYSILRAILNVVLAGVVMSILAFILWNLLAYAVGEPAAQVPANANIKVGNIFF